ncbi:polyprotein [Sesamum angolense]|uniref:Polyprotein n=1 Tax=Sesamum angolense TaxID=2727404 RepID=A0AAE1W0Y1_9LAMI|nr:polyprotein [Sesamum angolense]
MDHCSLPASMKEQYVTLSIPPDYISGWKAEGYTHLHLGAVKLVLSYRGRKGLPVTARIALLDTRFLEYEHAVIGTVLTTLNAGSIVVTFFPKFVVSLSDSHVASAFKVQVQITGANQVSASIMATLRHQLVFRLQNHSLDLPNQGSRDALMVHANSGMKIPTIIQIPRQIQRKDLEKLVPTEWITNYEPLQQQHESVKATDFRYKRLPDGRVKTIFTTQPDGEPSNPEFQLMITPIPVPEEIITPIASFGADGHHIYTDQINGHFIWDVNPSMCDPECSCEEDDDDSDDEDDIWLDYKSDEDDDLSSCNDSDDHYDESDADESQAFRTPQSCMMFQYETDFPPMERYVDSNPTLWIQKPIFTTQPLFGESPPPSPPDYSKYFFMTSDIPTDLPNATLKHPQTCPVKPEPFVTPSTESYETPSELEPPKITEPIYPYEKEDEDTDCASLEDSDMISEGSKDSEANFADITSILMADAESSRQP